MLTRTVPVALAALMAGMVASSVAGAHETMRAIQAERVRPLLAQELRGPGGQMMYAVVVTYPPGARSPRHHHAGSVLAYVLSGRIRSRNCATGGVRIYRAGESFFEPAGSEHLVSENAGGTESASMLAVFVAPRGAVLTTVDR